MADARARISWLHVSDLHVAKESLGHRPARRPGSELWAEVLRGFLADLDAQLDATGLRPDLVLVTGDLALSGATQQYDDLDAEFLAPVLGHLQGRGCDAVLVAVPGNHDVQRPSGAAKLGYRLLREYDTHDDQDEDLRFIRTELWQERNAAFLSPLFANYAAWSERTMLPGLGDRTLPSGLRIEGLHRSHLPGDLSVVAARDGLRLLLVGLNSAWVQFDGGDFKGKLHVPIEQLHAALSPDEHAALRRFDDVDAALLLMHHPRDWLSPAAVRTFDGYVYPARDERFTAFLFGHMHEARAETSAGNGGAMRYFYQSPSLFGLEHYGQTQARLDVGYTLGALYEDEEIRLWVRRLARSGRFDVDPELHREADGALRLRAGRPRAAMSSGATGSPRRIALPPGVDRPRTEVRRSDRAQLGAWLLSRHDKLELLAPTATFSYPFDEVYIPLEIAMQEAWRARSPEGDLVHGMGRDIDLAEIFARARDEREVMIFGNPGAGKTTTLEKICHQMLIEGGEAVGLPRATLPLLLPLRHATREDLAQDDPLYHLAQREIMRGDAPLSAEVLARLWEQGALLLLLDGLDEVADMELRDGLVRYVVQHAPARRRIGVRHIVSSRFSGVTRAIREVLDASFLRLDVRPLRRDRIEALVHSWFRAAKCWQVAPRTAEERARVEAEARAEAERVLAELRRIEHEDFEFKNLVATPLLLTLLCAVALANGQIPHKRPEFYQRCLEVLLRRYTQKTGRAAPVQEPEALRILQEVAYGLHEARRRDGLTAESLASWLARRADRSSRARMDAAEAAELLRWLHEHAGVLTKFGHDDYGFAHLTFQEYLSALHIAYGGEGPIETLADSFGDPWWQEVTLLCLALPLRRTFEVFMGRVLEGDRWLSDALGEDESAPEVQRESKLPMQLLRECWEDSEERSVEPFLRVLERPRTTGGWLMGWVRGLLGHAEGAERIDRQRIGVMQLLLGETDPELVALAQSLSTDPKESEAVRAIASELVARARRGASDGRRGAEAAEDQRRADASVDRLLAEEARLLDDVSYDWPGAALLRETTDASAAAHCGASMAEPSVAASAPAVLAKPAPPAPEVPRSEPAEALARALEVEPEPIARDDDAYAPADDACPEEDEAYPAAAGGAAAGDAAREVEGSLRPSTAVAGPVDAQRMAPVSVEIATAAPAAPSVQPAGPPAAARSVTRDGSHQRGASTPPATRDAPRAAAKARSQPEPAPAPPAAGPPPSTPRPRKPTPSDRRRTMPLPAAVVAPMPTPSAAPAPPDVDAPAPPGARRPTAAYAAAEPPTPKPKPAPDVAPRGPEGLAGQRSPIWSPPAMAEAAPRIDIDIENVCVEPVTKIRFLWVGGGHFIMGSDEDEPDAFEDERPQHLVKLRGFWLAETPVTNAQYAEYVKADGNVREPRYWRDRGLSGRDQPVVAVSWYEARSFCAWLGRQSGWNITLPSEAQWEYAARGVEGRRYPWGNEAPDETRACFGLSTSTGRTAPVGQYPRGRGPFEHLDLAGNVWEWCRDTGDASAYSRPDVWSCIDPVMDDPYSDLRVCRGGGWYDPSTALRAARRTLCPGVSSSVAQGFRVCRILGSGSG
jgi:formylglycine-generating enzyme required for sulfatase activity